MARESKETIYYRKAFECCKRAYNDALSQAHPYSKRTMPLANPRTGQVETVLSVLAAINWTMHYFLPHWASSTWRMSRQGFKLLIERGVDPTLTSEQAVKLCEKMDLAKGTAKAKRPKRTSAKRKKNITKEQLDKIVGLATDMNATWSVALVYWLKSSVATGLRPNEWREAELFNQGERIILRSPNFKYNEVRSYAKSRDIDITDLSVESKKAITNHLQIIALVKSQGIEEQHYRGCGYLLHRINKKLWPRRKLNITLYTGRHQFSSNAKAEPNCSEEERAAMMGHATTKTSRERYGRKKSGKNGLTPEIANKDVLSLIKNPPMKRPVSQVKPTNVK